MKSSILAVCCIFTLATALHDRRNVFAVSRNLILSGICGDERNCAHCEQGGNQGRLPSDAIAEVAKERRTDGACEKCDGECGE